MADTEELKILITTEDVGGQTANQLKDIRKNIQGLQADTKIGSSEFKGYQQQLDLISNSMRNAQGKGESLTQTIRSSRQEARLFRFAMTEMIAGFDGLVTAGGMFTGSSESTKASLKDLSGAMKEGLGAGLGLKFGLDAIGGSFAALAGPIGLIVGVMTLLGSAMGKAAEENKKNQDELDKLQDRLIKLQYETGQLTDATYLNNLQAEISISKMKEQAIQAELTQKSFGNLLDYVMGKNTILEINKRLEAQKVATQEALKGYDDAQKHIKETNKKEEDENFKAIENFQKVLDESLAEDDRFYKEKERKRKQDAKDAADQAKELLDIHDQMQEAFIASESSTTKQELDEEQLRFDKQKRYWEQARHDFPDLKKEIDAAIINEEKAFSNKMNEIAFPAGKEEKKTPKEFTQEWMSGIDILRTGFSALHSSIQSGIVNALGEAHSLFQQFVAGVLEGLAQIAEKLAESAIIAGIFSLVTGGSFGGAFGALSGFGGGKGGGVAQPNLSSLTSFQSGSSMAFAGISGEFKIKGRDLVASVKQARLIDRKKGGNF